MTTRLTGLNILLIEDNPDMQDLVAFILRRAGAVLVAASTSCSGVDWVKRQHFDAVLVDLGLPDAAGEETVSALRRGGYGGPAIVFTADESQAARQRAELAGATFLPKSADRAALIDAVAQATSR